MPEVRKERRDKGQPRWTQRDIRLLGWTGEQYAVRLDQLRELLSRDPLGKLKGDDASESTVRHCVERWRRGGLADYASLVVRQPGWVWLTPKGLRWMGLEYRGWEPRLPALNHLFYVNEARLWLENQQEEWAWVSERTLRARQEKRTSKSVYDHLPDAEAWQGQSRVAIEVELSRKDEDRLRRIIYGLEREYHAIYYFTLPLIHERVSKVLAKMEPNVRQRVVMLVWREDETTGKWEFLGRQS